MRQLKDQGVWSSANATVNQWVEQTLRTVRPALQPAARSQPLAVPQVRDLGYQALAVLKEDVGTLQAEVHQLPGTPPRQPAGQDR